MRPGDLVLLLGSTMRLIRLVTVDSVGLWLIREPAYRYVKAHQPTRPPQPPPAKAQAGSFAPTGRAYGGIEPETEPVRPNLVTKLYLGLDCPFCVGYWIGLANLLVMIATRNSPLAANCWRAVAASLTLNEVAAHLGARVGDVADDD